MHQHNIDYNDTSYRTVRSGYYFSSSFEQYYPASEQFSLSPIDTCSGNEVRQTLYAKTIDI